MFCFVLHSVTLVSQLHSSDTKVLIDLKQFNLNAHDKNNSNNLGIFIKTFDHLYPIEFQMSKSNEHQVVLKKVQISSSGSYKCEVVTHLTIVLSSNITIILGHH